MTRLPRFVTVPIAVSFPVLGGHLRAARVPDTDEEHLRDAGRARAVIRGPSGKPVGGESRGARGEPALGPGFGEQRPALADVPLDRLAAERAGEANGEVVDHPFGDVLGRWPAWCAVSGTTVTRSIWSGATMYQT